MRKCYICQTTQNIERHHIFFGISNRKISDRHKFTVDLCAEHHRGHYSPHHSKQLDLALRRITQKEYEKTHTRKEFMDIIGQNYLD